MTDLLDIVGALERAARLDEVSTVAGTTTGNYAAHAHANIWLIEHLRFTVPFCAAHLDEVARRGRLWLTYDEIVHAELAKIGREIGGSLGGVEPQTTLAAIVGALADSLMGGSKPGRGAAVAMAVAWALAGISLVCDAGASYGGLHWCKPAGCSCTPVVDEVAA